MTKHLTRLIAVLLFTGGTAVASVNPSPMYVYEDFQATVDRIIAEGAKGGCFDPEQVVWL